MDEFVFRTEELTNRQVLELGVLSDFEKGIIDKLKAPSPVLLVGSRGVGKSFLFKMAEIQMLNEFEKEKVLPVSLTFRKASLLKSGNEYQFQYWMLGRICSEVLRAIRKIGKFASFSHNIALLTGSTPKKDKDRIYEELANGTIQLIIGTHALIQDKVQFKNLGLVIIDEQHRFGVNQRAALQHKGVYPHVLIMTATPIPRTMTLSVYGDLAVSLIKEMPPGRKPVKTYVVDSSYKERLRVFFGKEMAAGHQVYVVCPLVEESEKLDLQAAEELFLELKDYFYKSFEVGLVHGRMNPKEKDEVMQAFHDGRIQLLVSTTVIEVGVNVPNATIMCIEGAERFGLSQLHQLRGRVGRGDIQAYCILVSDSKGDVSQERLRLMESTQDGFELAEQDLLLRGSGQLFGLAQSGLPDLRVANIIKDIDILVTARNDVLSYIREFGIDQLEIQMKEELSKRFGEKFLRILYN